MSKYTELELKVLNIIKEISNETSEIYLKHLVLDIADAGIPSNKSRGAISSLIKKTAIDISHDYDKFVSILDEDYQGESYNED